MSDYYSRNGEPMSMQEWAKELEAPDAKRVASTTLPNGYWVSTVWLGIDHSFGGVRPIIFETMVFKHDKTADGGAGVTEWGEVDSDRYSTEAEALEGHARLVNEWGSK